MNAFPADTLSEGYTGMSLRDYFAAKAMQGLISNKLVMQTVADEFVGEGSQAIGRIAYQFADAMIKQREL